MRLPVPATLALVVLLAVPPIAAQNLPPVPVISVTPASGRPNTVFAFTGRASADPDGWIAAFYWTFGDGGFTTAANATHRYAGPGTYTVSLTVSDDEGLNATAWSQLNVTGQNQLPVIESWSPVDTQVMMDLGAMQAFRVTVTDPDGDVLSYTWRVDGGVRQEVEGVNTSFFTYQAISSGSHTVEVAVSDGLVAQNQSWGVVVKVAPPPASPAGPSFLPVLAGVLVLVVVLVLLAAVLTRHPAPARVYAPPVPPGAPWCYRCGATLGDATSCPACGTLRFRG